MRCFPRVDLIVAPATPCTAPAIGQKPCRCRARPSPVRPNLGLFTQPFSCIGLPVAAVPVFATGPMPIGVQIVAAPWREDLCLRAAQHLEASGIAASPRPQGF